MCQVVELRLPTTRPRGVLGASSNERKNRGVSAYETGAVIVMLLVQGLGDGQVSNPNVCRLRAILGVTVQEGDGQVTSRDLQPAMCEWRGQVLFFGDGDQVIHEGVVLLYVNVGCPTRRRGGAGGDVSRRFWVFSTVGTWTRRGTKTYPYESPIGNLQLQWYSLMFPDVIPSRAPSASPV